MNAHAYLLAALLTVTGHPYVIDGDTLAFDRRGLSDVRVRLQGSDAPEMGTLRGLGARWALIRYIAGRSITCTQTTPRRTYGRWIARCTTPDGRDLDHLMIKGGWSRTWR